MQAYDLIMLIVLGMATIFGAIKGFAWQVASIASVIVSYVVAYRFRFDVAEMIQAKPPWNQFLAMLILYVGTSFVIWVAFRLLSGMIDRVRLKEFDRHMGAAFGLGKGLIYCLLITMFAMSLLGPNQRAAICQSRSGYYITTALDRGVGVLPKEIHDVVGPYLANLDDKLKSGQAGTDTNTQGGLNWPGLSSELNNLPELSAGLSGVLQGLPIPGQDTGQSILPPSGQASGNSFSSEAFPPTGFPGGFMPPNNGSGFPLQGNSGAGVGVGGGLGAYDNSLRPAGGQQAQQQSTYTYPPR